MQDISKKKMARTTATAVKETSVPAPAASRTPVAVKATKAAKVVEEAPVVAETPVRVAKPRAARAPVEVVVEESTPVTAEVVASTGGGRRQVTSESVEAEFTSIIEYLNSDAVSSADAKFVRGLRKRLDLLQKDTRRVTGPKRRATAPRTGNVQKSGILMDVPLTNEAADFIGVAHGTSMSRVAFSNHITAYVTKHGLKNTAKGQGREIIPDKPLTKLLRYSQKECVDTSLDKKGNAKNPDGKLYYHTVQKLMQRCFVKAPVA